MAIFLLVEQLVTAHCANYYSPVNDLICSCLAYFKIKNKIKTDFTHSYLIQETFWILFVPTHNTSEQHLLSYITNKIVYNLFFNICILTLDCLHLMMADDSRNM
jgi:hypothetical protein